MKVDRDILNNLCLNITDGEHGTIQNDNDGRYFLLSNKNIINGQIIISDADRRINKESFSKINKRTKLENGDLVISTVGVLGKLAIIKAENLNYDFQRSVGIVKCDEKKINTKYLYYYLNTQFVQNRLNHLSKGAVQKCLFISDLKNLEIDFPDLPTQQKIASVLSALDDKIELNNRINAELEAMAKTLYDYWFVQFDFPIVTSSGVEKPYKSSGGKMVYNETLKREIPEGWEVKTVGNILDKNKATNKINAKEYLNMGKIPVIDQSTNLICGFTNDESSLITTKEKPAIVFGDHTRILKLINFDFARGADGTQILFSKIENMPQFLLYYSLLKIDLSNYGYARHFKFLKEQNLLIPKKEIAKEFNDLVKSYYVKIYNNLKQNQELSALRDWLLPMLMNGQVKVG